MRKNTRKCLSLLVAVALLVSTLPVAPVAAAQSSENVIPAGDENTQPALSDTNEPVKPAGKGNYWDKNENSEWKIKPIPKDVIIVDENTKQWNNDKNGGWYIVQGDVTITNRIIVSKNIRLILADNATLTAKAGIGVLSDKSLTIYTQSYGEDMGEILANTDDVFSFGEAGIGGNDGGNGGTIIVNGGKITANGGEGAAGIGAGEGKDGGTVIINGGNVEATGGSGNSKNHGGAGIGGGESSDGGTIIINGGTVNAKGAVYSAGIGGGFDGDGGTITISGGHVTANGGEAAAGIGGGNGSQNPTGNGGIITISGGTVTATGGANGAGIGGGDDGDGGDITITGGNITATGGENGAGIGGGDSGNVGDLTIDGGKVTAISTGYGAAIGNGESGDGGSITINRGEVIATSQNRGAGIGGSHSGDAGDITITGGIVEANGSVYGSGIGSGGNGGSGGKIIISGGTIIANGGEKDGEGIGSSPKGTFSTTDDGNAVIIASRISDNDATDWHGLIIQGSEGKIYGNNVVPSEAFTIPKGTTVTIDEEQQLIIGDAITMTNKGTIINKGAPIEGEVRGNQPIRAITSITLNSAALSLKQGATAKLTASTAPEPTAEEAPDSLTWSSSDDAIATVDEHGNVTAVSAGTATITAKATYGLAEATCAVTVVTESIPAESITIAPKELSMNVGENESLTATVTPDNATDQVIWSSSDKNVATVDQSGKVIAKAKGKAIITATAGDKSATCTVTVTPPVDSITLNKDALDLKVGESGTLKATIEPDGAATDISWTSSAPAVAAVDAQGKVKALAPGKATITATAGGKSATCTVTVSQPATGISLDKSKLTLAVGERSQLKAILKPANATDKVHWESSYQAVATVDENGWVTAHKKGTAVITAKVGGFSATCTVIVTPQATSIALDRDVLSLQVGERATLQATVQPPETTESVRWISSNEAVAMVDENGIVTAVGAGQAIITARAGKAEATCTVTVVGNSGGDLSVSVGASEHGYILLSPDDCYAVAGDRVTFTVMPDNGYKLKSVSVITADGKTVVLNNEGSGVYSFIMPEGKVTITVTFVKDSEAAVDNVFNDVSTNAWYLDNVQYVYDNGLMTGVDATHFAPEASMTRAMFVSVLARYAGDTTPAAPGEPWYEGARQWAIANGVSDGTMMDTSISREQLVTMLYRYAGAPQGTGDLSGFSDAGSVSIYAQDAMRWAVGEGIIGGMTADTLAPQSGATRAKVAAILQRFIEG